MSKEIMNDLDLNIQLHTLYGSFSMLVSSTQYRYSIIEDLIEQTNALSNMLYNAIEIEGQKTENSIMTIIDYLSELKERLNLYGDQYGQSINIVKNYESDISDFYKRLMNNEIDKSEFKSFYEDIDKINYDSILGDDFIDYNRLIDSFSDEVRKLENNKIISQLLGAIQQTETQFLTISQQNDVIASTIELIQRVKTEVK